MTSLAEHDLPSDSDDSDVDFKPSDEESLPSEEDSDGCVEEPTLENEEQQSAPKKGKRKKKQTKGRKKMKKNTQNGEKAEEENESVEVKKLSPEEEKKKEEELWNDFMKDCGRPVRKTSTTDTTSHSEGRETKPVPREAPVIEKENKAVVTEIFEFAGEKIKVEKEVPRASGVVRGGVVGRGRGRGGLASLVGQLGKKNKLSVLEKTKLDWDRFKKEEGIEEDLQTHNKGKEGYLEKQDFLQRADLRQFEIEKQLRTTSRRSNP